MQVRRMEWCMFFVVVSYFLRLVIETEISALWHSSWLEEYSDKYSSIFCMKIFISAWKYVVGNEYPQHMLSGNSLCFLIEKALSGAKTHSVVSVDTKRSWSGPKVIKKFFMLNSAEHEICPANKSQIINNCKFFLTKYSWAWTFLS